MQLLGHLEHIGLVRRGERPREDERVCRCVVRRPVAGLVHVSIIGQGVIPRLVKVPSVLDALYVQSQSRKINFSGVVVCTKDDCVCWRSGDVLFLLIPLRADEDHS